MEALPDNTLMMQVREGNLARLSTLFDRHQKPLFHFYLRMTGNREASEDLVQDVFFRILKYRRSYRTGTDFAAWMYRIARNSRWDYFRHRSREVVLDGELEASLVAESSATQSLQRRQERQFLERALASLPHDKREVLILSRFQNLRYEQIAAIYGCEAGTVKVRVHRALRQLKEIYTDLVNRRAS